MNNVNLIGRLTKDPVVRYSGEHPIATFTLAIDRPPKPDGTKDTDYPRVTAHGKQAEFCGKYLQKGNRAAIVGRIKTGSYVKDGHTVYTTDIIANRVEIIDWPPKEEKMGHVDEEFYF